MSLSKLFLTEFEQEMTHTRKTIERITDDKFNWRPHEKSFTMGDLATHLANIQTWVNATLNMDEFDMHPKEGEEFIPPKAENKNEVLELFDKNNEEAKQSLTNTSDEKLNENWSLLSGGNTIFTMPKSDVIRSFVLNHIIHHRAQLGIYLRLNDIPVPAIYGPTADEGAM